MKGWLKYVGYATFLQQQMILNTQTEIIQINSCQKTNFQVLFHTTLKYESHHAILLLKRFQSE